MKNLQEINKMIYEIRQTLNTTIEEKQDLLDSEVIDISQKLDSVLNKYNNLLIEEVS